MSGPLTPDQEAFVARCRAQWREDADGLSPDVRNRLSRARATALNAMNSAPSRPFRVPGFWLPAAVCGVAGMLALAVWLSRPVVGSTGAADMAPVEDAELLASTDEPDLYAEEAAFYDWAGSDNGAG
jgi:hypothetical protein